MNIKNTNITLRNGAYIITFEGEKVRHVVITYNKKETIKTYKKAGFRIFASPVYFDGYLFFALTKSFKFRTRNKKKIVISNEIWHLENALKKDQLKTA